MPTEIVLTEHVIELVSPKLQVQMRLMSLKQFEVQEGEIGLVLPTRDEQAGLVHADVHLEASGPGQQLRRLRLGRPQLLLVTLKEALQLRLMSTRQEKHQRGCMVPAQTVTRHQGRLRWLSVVLLLLEGLLEPW